MYLSRGVYVTSLTLSVKRVSWEGGPPATGAVQMLRTPDLSVVYATVFFSLAWWRFLRKDVVS